MDVNKKFELKVENGEVIASVDTNQDGEKVLTARLVLTEAVQEALQRQSAVEGVKSASIKFSGNKLTLEVDTDKDGEKVLTLELDLFEVVDETGLLK